MAKSDFLCVLYVNGVRWRGASFFLESSAVFDEVGTGCCRPDVL